MKQAGSEEIRGPWGVIHVEAEMVAQPLGYTGPISTWRTRYYLNGEPISEDEARRLVEGDRP